MSQQDLAVRPAQQALDEVMPERGISASSSPDPGSITETLMRAREQAFLISPSATCPNLPLGCEVAFSSVLVDENNSAEVYEVNGKKALSKTSLNRIAKAAGVDWDSRESRRTDDGKTSTYASYKAVGRVRDFDGTWRTITGEKAVDLTDGSELARTLKSGDLSQQRKFIAEMAETKAKLRAIRSMGIPTSFEKGQLAKPFVCARLVFTGRTNDPELQKIFAVETARAMLGGTEALYGGRPALSPMPHDEESDATVAASAEGTAGEQGNGQGEVAKTESGTVQSDSEPKIPVWKVPFGKFAGVPISDVPDDRLSGLVDYVDMSMEDGANASRTDELTLWKKMILADVDRRKGGNGDKGDKGTIKY